MFLPNLSPLLWGHAFSESGKRGEKNVSGIGWAAQFEIFLNKTPILKFNLESFFFSFVTLGPQVLKASKLKVKNNKE